MSRRNCRLQFPKEKKENSFLYQCNKFPVPYSHNTAGKKRRKTAGKNFTKGPFTLAKTKIQKTWVFCCTVYTARKTHSIRDFWHEKRMREKTESHTCVLVSGAHARLLSTFDRTRVVRITSRAAVG